MDIIVSIHAVEGDLVKVVEESGKRTRKLER